MRFFVLVVVSVFFVFSLAACSRKEAPPAGAPTRVSATKAYQRYFGPAPTTDKGTCYAFVIYFPSGKDPAQALPLPFFTFDKDSMKKVALQRLIGGLTDVRAYRSEVRQPFPAGSRLLDLREDDGVVTANFSAEVGAIAKDAASRRAVANAVVLTLRQFEGVKTVRLAVNGKDALAEDVAAAGGEGGAIEPGAPRLLSVTAMRERGEKDVEEVNAFFDRPVDIKQLQMSGPDGTAFAGELYHAVFDMAAVLKPKEAAPFKASMPIRVRWDVTDKRGRHSAGETQLALEIKQH